MMKYNSSRAPRVVKKTHVQYMPTSVPCLMSRLYDLSWAGGRMGRRSVRLIRSIKAKVFGKDECENSSRNETLQSYVWQAFCI